MEGLDPRRQRLWGLQDFAQGHGLEIGPLHEAIVRKDQADVSYVDIKDQAGLRDYYRDDPEVALDRIPEIDYPLTQPDGSIVSLAEASRPGAPYDWVMASHVIEHVPDLIGWLSQIAEVVVDHGALVLAVPDRRYTFDVHRPPTTVGAMLEAHELGAVRPGVRAVYDHYSRVVDFDVTELWQGLVPTSAARQHGLLESQALVQKSLDSYIACHVWLFTPDSFVEQLDELRQLGLSSWYVDEVSPTLQHQIEFVAKLRRVPRHQPLDQPVDGELLPSRNRPEWLDDPGRVDRVDALEQKVAKLEQRLERRAARAGQLRAQVVRQRRVIRRQRAELTSLRASLPARAVRLARSSARRLRHPRGSG